MHRRLAGAMALIVILAAGVEGYAAIRHRDTLEVLGSHLQIEDDCRGRRLEVAGNDLVISLSGVCAGVVVQGNDNRVTTTIAEGASLQVGGMGNDVRWASPGEVAVSVLGQNNRVRRSDN